MNTLQIIRAAHFEIDALRADGVTTGLWTPEESRRAANSAMERAARIIRLADSDILSRSLLSTAAAEEFIYETYDPSDLSIQTDVSEYTLPPDYVSIVNIVPISTGFDGVRFRPAKLHERYFTDERTIPDADLRTVNGAEMVYQYTIIGERTLRLAPTPKDDFDIELIYRYRPAPLRVYSTGTVDVTNQSTTVHGLGVTWTQVGLRLPAELVVGTTVSLDTTYQRIASFDSEVDLTLSKPYAGVSDAEAVYSIAMVPTIPEEHHEWLAHMTAAMLLRKTSIDLSDKARAALEAQLMAEVQPEIVIRQSQESLPVEPFNA